MAEGRWNPGLTLRYSHSAPQLSSARTSKSSAIHFPSCSASSTCLRTSCFDDSELDGSVSSSTLYAATEEFLASQSSEHQGVGHFGDVQKQDEEALLARINFEEAPSGHSRDVVPGGRLSKLVCTSILTIVCCLLAAQLVLDKVSELNEDDTLTTLGEINGTERALVSEERKERNQRGPSKIHNITNVTAAGTASGEKWSTRRSSVAQEIDALKTESDKAIALRAFQRVAASPLQVSRLQSSTVSRIARSAITGGSRRSVRVFTPSPEHGTETTAARLSLNMTATTTIYVNTRETTDVLSSSSRHQDEYITPDQTALSVRAPVHAPTSRHRKRAALKNLNEGTKLLALFARNATSRKNSALSAQEAHPVQHTYGGNSSATQTVMTPLHSFISEEDKREVELALQALREAL
ncbi:hypothetical protein MTO96_028780 [Rhipicephalus appendiculatus]